MRSPANTRSFKAKGLALNMARGKPSRAQLDLSMPMLTCIVDVDDCTAEDGTDCRNYGVLDGIPEAKRLMAVMLDDDAEHVVVFGKLQPEHHVLGNVPRHDQRRNGQQAVGQV